MKNNLSLFIVSKGRHNKQITLESLPKEVLELTTVVVPYDEYLLYRPVCEKFGVNLRSAPAGVCHVATQRQFCTEICTTRFFAMADDDIVFSYRNEEGKLRPADAEKIREIFETMYSDLLAGIPAVGISPRFGNNFTKEDYIEVGRMYRIWAFDLSIYKELNITMAPYPEFLMEDFHWLLTFLENGYKNRVYYKYAQDDKGGSNAEGGCSTYRTAEVNRRAALWLMQQHPTAVSLTTKRGWQGMERRTDVHVEWQKAYQPKREKRTFTFGKKR